MKQISRKLKSKLKKAGQPAIPNAEKLKGRSFIIHSMPRTASTSLRTWLNQQDGMICHGEILGPNNVHGTSDKQEKKFGIGRRNRHPYDFARSYFADHDQSQIGFKALSSHMLEGRNLAFVRWFFDTEPKAIMLYRDDLVARYKSALYHRLYNGNASSEYVLSLKPKDVMADCISIREQWQMANQYWTKNCESVSINIKNLSETGQSQVEALLGVKLSGQMPRSNSESTAEAKTNHPELVAHVEKICGNRRLDPFRQMSFDI